MQDLSSPVLSLAAKSPVEDESLHSFAVWNPDSVAVQMTGAGVQVQPCPALWVEQSSGFRFATIDVG